MTFRRSEGGSSTTTKTTSGSVDVRICGKKLSIRSDQDPKHVTELADYVNGKVESLRELAPSVPVEKLLMLASLTIAEELFDARGDNDALRATLKKRVDAAIALVDEVEADL